MTFQPTKVPNVFEIGVEPIRDGRGFFARSWCRREFANHGLNTNLAQCNISFNHQKGTLRGMHLQAEPHAEAKLVRCTRGSIFDVAVDLRPKSSTFKEWVGVTLTSANRNMLYIPEGFAHGFLTLDDETEVFYQMSAFHNPDAARGFRWDDPAFQIAWPAPVRVISERDRTYPNFSDLWNS